VSKSRTFDLAEALVVLGKGTLVLGALGITVALALRIGTTPEAERLTRFCRAMRATMQVTSQELRERGRLPFSRQPELRWLDFGLCNTDGMAPEMRRRLDRCADGDPSCAAAVFEDLAAAIR
jgi:hypothetical protein